MGGLDTRVKKLERRLLSAVIDLTMPDGSVQQVNSNRLLLMFTEATVGIVKSDTALVIESVSDNGAQKGCGEMCNLIRMMARKRPEANTPAPTTRPGILGPLPMPTPEQRAERR